jgi:hypothetical protein
MRKPLLLAIVLISTAGFLSDVLSWARQGNHGIAAVLWQYWWAVLIIVSYIAHLLGTRSRRREADKA